MPDRKSKPWFGDCRRWLIAKDRSGNGWVLLWPESNHQPAQTLPTFDAARELFIALTDQAVANA